MVKSRVLSNHNKIMRKMICIVLIIILLTYLILSLIPNKSYAVEASRGKVEDLDESKYPGFKEKLLQLQKDHPNWNFTILYTGLDWADVIENETVKSRNVVPSSKTGEWICQEHEGTVEDNWRCASAKTVAYYMDPRNFLTDDANIFQFETLYYEPKTQTLEGVRKVVKGTFMDSDYRIYYTDTEGNEQFLWTTYGEVIMAAAEATGVSPYHLAARIRQEQGTGDLINCKSTSSTGSGNYPGYVGYYNYFNIDASGSDRAARALKRAQQEGWTNPEKSIMGGASFLKDSYIGVGQDTLYLQKFAVYNTNGSLYWHQYMSNIMAPTSESATMYNRLYSAPEQTKNLTINFIIPVYENMPQEASPIPRDTIPEENGIILDGIKIYENEDKKIKIEPDITFEKMQEQLKDRGTISLLDNTGKLLTDTSKLATGYKVRITKDEKSTDYVLIKLGDANGDAIIDAVDLLMLKKQLLGTISLEDEYLEALKLNKSSAQIDAVDLLMLKKQLLGTLKLTV